MSFKHTYFPTSESGVSAIETIFTHAPNVFLVISRKKNGNVVCYEALLDNDKNIVGIDVYWLDLDPAFRKKSRQKNRGSDRYELTTVDRMGYDIKIIDNSAKRKWKLCFKVYSQHMTVVQHNDKIFLYRKGKNGKLQILKYLYVHDQNNGLGLPTVTSVDLVGHDARDINKKFIEKITH